MAFLDEPQGQFFLGVCITNAIIALCIYAVMRMHHSRRRQLKPRKGLWFEFSFVLGPLLSMPFALLPFLIDALFGTDVFGRSSNAVLLIVIFCTAYAFLGPLAGLLWRQTVYRFASTRLQSRLQMSLYASAYAVIAGFVILFTGELFFALPAFVAGMMSFADIPRALGPLTLGGAYFIGIFAPFAGIAAGLITAFIGFEELPEGTPA